MQVKQVVTVMLALGSVWFAPATAQADEQWLQTVPPVLDSVKIHRFSANGDEFVQGRFDSVFAWFRDRNQATSSQALSSQEATWLQMLNRPHPSIDTLRRIFQEASLEFRVPADLLMAIGRVENNWTQVGPTIDQGFGIMHLVNNNYSQTLGEAAALIQVDPKAIESDARTNIRAGAALLAHLAGADRERFAPEDWVAPLMQYSGLIDQETRSMQVREYLRVWREGSTSYTLWKEQLVLTAHESPELMAAMGKLDRIQTRQMRSTDYPGAEASFTTCNFSSRNGADIDVWVNHYIGTGTIPGAISWFKNCTAQASAHFVIDRTGHIYQVVAVADKAWHAGATGTTNNQRSIGIEHDATAADPGTWNDERMLKASAEMAAFFCDKYAITKVRRLKGESTSGIYGHNDMPGCSTSCPGPLPWDKWMAYLTPVATKTRLVGVVFDQSSADMSVRIPGASLKLPSGATTTARQDDAYWSFEVDPGTFTVEATAGGYQTNQRTCTTTQGQDTWCSIGLAQAGCQKDCTGRDCGNDPVCGQSCGTCLDTQSCSQAGKCECVQKCEQRQCGPDPVCNLSCGTCSDNQTCQDGVCVQNPPPGGGCTTSGGWGLETEMLWLFLCCATWIRRVRRA